MATKPIFPLKSGEQLLQAGTRVKVPSGGNTPAPMAPAFLNPKNTNVRREQKAETYKGGGIVMSKKSTPHSCK